MATINPSAGYPDRPDGTQEALRYVFALSTGDDSAPVQYIQHADLTWQVSGTFGGSTFTAQGSNDGANWFTLQKADGSGAATLTAPGGFTTIERPVLVRGVVSAGAASGLSFALLLRKMPQMRTN